MATQCISRVRRTKDKGCILISYLKIGLFRRFDGHDVCASISVSSSIDIRRSLCSDGCLSGSVVRSAHGEVKSIVLDSERRVNFLGKVWVIDGSCWIRHCDKVQ